MRSSFLVGIAVGLSMFSLALQANEPSYKLTDEVDAYEEYYNKQEYNDLMVELADDQ